jgi:hypothetical protein
LCYSQIPDPRLYRPTQKKGRKQAAFGQNKLSKSALWGSGSVIPALQIIQRFILGHGKNTLTFHFQKTLYEGVFVLP